MNDPRLANARSPHVSTIRTEHRLVRPEAGCPYCGNREMDTLEVQDDDVDVVLCTKCESFFDAFSSH
jgi:Zn ribbon nucleic-acid-binding protein